MWRLRVCQMWLTNDSLDSGVVELLEVFEQVANVSIEAGCLTSDPTVGLIKVRAIEDGIKFGYWTKLDTTQPLSEIMAHVEQGYIWSLKQPPIGEGQTYHEYVQHDT